MFLRVCFKSLVAAGLVLGAGSTCSPLLAAPPVNFSREIRPLLSDACFQCHGPDEQQRKGGLRLDVVDSTGLRGESGSPVVVPGAPDESELWLRIGSDDPQVQMPPPESGKSLSPQQQQRFRDWIEGGAKAEGHWAFSKPVRPSVPQPTVPPSSFPASAAGHWLRNPIDRFIVDRLQRQGLALSPQADRPTLIRRVTLDLTGLPPTPAEIDAFLADPREDAYERVVDRLLTSPRYGEQMAQGWLDFARYADSNGFQIDSSRQMWPWRDWVIAAFNRNLPYDQFTIEQLAGDLLPDADRSQRVATGFHRNHRLNGEGGIIAEEWRVETVIDRVETTGLTWLGLTFNCCRCHDHKYDPISQREFYRLFSFFNNITESGTLQGESRNTDPVLPVPTAQQQAELERLDREVAAAQAEVERAAIQLPELVAAWEPEFRKQLSQEVETWKLLEPRSLKSLGGADLTRQPDGTWLASGKNPANDIYELVAPLAPGLLSGLLLEAFPDPSLPNQSLGRYPNGNFVLTRVEATLSAPDMKAPQALKVTRAVADYSQPDWDVAHVVAGNTAKGWAVDGPTRREPRRAMFLFQATAQVPADAVLTVRLHHEAISQHNIGRFRLSTTGVPAEAATLEGAKIPDSIRRIVETPPAKRSPEMQSELAAYFRSTADSPLRRADARVAELQTQLAAAPAAFPNVMVMVEGPPREARVLIRGQYDKPGEVVTAGLPAILPPLPAGAPLNRLGLARWMVDPEHPLTARVWVNRAWERFFGVGLVKTSENLGSQAEYPSHPELLDWLACEFMRPTVTPAAAWDMKAFHKLLVTSATYRQSSRVTAALLELDPDNRLLARGPRFRLSAEAVRDQALAVSGLLTEKVGGPSVRPYMPEGVWDETSRYGDLLNYRHDPANGLYRRSLYTIWKRTAAPPSMLLFDAPNREVCTVRRSRTNTPLQALALLNEVTFVEAARKLAERMLREGGTSSAERLTFGFRLVTARLPSPDELRILEEGLEADLDRYRAAPELAAKLLQVGEAKPTSDVAEPVLAAWTLTANTLLNLDEATTRE